jgi:adenylate cyclase
MIKNYKVSLVCLLLFSMTSISVFPQNIKIDSLKNIVATKAKDTSMVSTLNALSIEFLKEDLQKAQVYAEQAGNLATKLHFNKGKAYALKNIGLVSYYQGNYLKVLDYWTQSLETFEAIHDTLGIAKLVNNLGAVYYNQGSRDKALDYYLQSLQISEKIQNPNNIVQALLNVGGLYTEIKEYDKALAFFNRIDNYRTAIKNTDLITSYLMGVGEVYFEQGLYNDALKSYEEALSSNKNINLRGDNLIKLGIVEFKIGNKEKALKFLNEAYKTAKENNQQSIKVQALIALGSVNQKSNLDKAINEYKEAEVIARKIEANDELRDVYEGLYKTYELKSDYSNAFKYQKKYITQKDSLFNLATDDKIRGLQFDFDLEKKEDKIGLLEKESEIQQLNEKRQKVIIYATGIALLLIFLLAIGLYKRYKFVRETNQIIEEEKNRSDNLLKNILPEETALELKQNGKVAAKKFESVTVLFTDFKGFTDFAKDLSPEELVSSVDFYFSKFDEIMGKYGMEKIKTIGDAYMCAGGLPYVTNNHAFRMVQAAFEIAEFIEESKKSSDGNNTNLDIRIGINTGPIVAGVVGTKKFAYDIWGDTVNVASRMETLSTPSRINISEYTYELIKDVFECEYRGEIEVKNRGMMKMYFVNGIKDKALYKSLDLQKIAI